MLTTAARASWAGLLLLALALHAASLAADGGRVALWHMLWSCHVATFLLAVGFLARWRCLIAAGFLFHLGIGLPAWLVQVIVTHGTFGGATLVPHLLATSILAHMAPLAAGAAMFWRQPLPRAALPIAWVIQVAMVPVAHWLTPAELNVNLSYAPWPPLAGVLPTVWRFQSLESAACLATLTIMLLVWDLLLAHKTRRL